MVPAISRYQDVTSASHPGEDCVDHLKQATAAEGRRRLFQAHDDVLTRAQCRLSNALVATYRQHHDSPPGPTRAHVVTTVLLP